MFYVKLHPLGRSSENFVHFCQAVKKVFTLNIIASIVGYGLYINQHNI